MGPHGGLSLLGGTGFPAPQWNMEHGNEGHTLLPIDTTTTTTVTTTATRLLPLLLRVNNYCSCVWFMVLLQRLASLELVSKLVCVAKREHIEIFFGIFSLHSIIYYLPILSNEK